MAETLCRASPFEGLDLAIPLLTLRVSPPRRRLIARGDADLLDRSFALSLPRAPNRAHRTALTDALWLGPDEWLLLTDSDLIGSGLVDISHRLAGMELSGPHAAAALNAGCPLDLHGTAFPADTCTRTLFGKAEIILWRTAPDAFHIEIARSFIPYVTAFLREAARGLA